VEEVECLEDGTLIARLKRKHYASVAGTDSGQQEPLLVST
jgi:hypothetical protein